LTAIITNKTLQKAHKEIVKLIHELSGLVQIFWRDTITIYGEQIEFRLLFTYQITHHRW